MQGRHPPQHKQFTTFSLADKVPQHNIYYQLRQQLNLDFLYQRTVLYYGKAASNQHDPVVFFNELLDTPENLNSDRSVARTHNNAARSPLRRWL